MKVAKIFVALFLLGFLFSGTAAADSEPTQAPASVEAEVEEIGYAGKIFRCVDQDSYPVWQATQEGRGVACYFSAISVVKVDRSLFDTPRGGWYVLRVDQNHPSMNESCPEGSWVLAEGFFLESLARQSECEVYTPEDESRLAEEVREFLSEQSQHED